ncbi:MAG: ABC-F family ATP-binding cassette domain-containing protein [Oscillospiraceae bacterium]|nr:ABC-F family ATP-binding cassette domain-containing protein [Oscillospiraceae bacterium]
MIDVLVSSLSKEFEVGNKILDGLSFQVDTGERVGILGKNGAGKSTLFRILTGETERDGGDVMLAPGKRIGLISQIPVYPEGYTVRHVLECAFARLREAQQELERLAENMADGDPAVLKRYDALSDILTAGGGYDTETRLSRVCNGLGISEEMRLQPFASLSGGEKTRVNLARLILEDTDILLLDEPTNHLDLRATEWLEEYLGHFKGTMLAISHDRWFLDRVVTRCIEIAQGRAELYAGNYSFYVTERERRLLERQKQYEKEQAQIAQLQEAANDLHQWGMEKLHKRAFAIEKRISRMETTHRPQQERKLQMRFSEQAFSADEMLVLQDVRMAYAGRTLFEHVNLEVTGGERIALLGDNGAGKSTFLRLLIRELEPLGGSIRQGPATRVAYLPQIIRFSHPERNLVDTMIYEENCATQEARDRLGAFRFRGEDVFKPVSALSGGEQSRLRLCMLMNDRMNLLILDEPTNHLDLASREWIEEAVEDYGGTLLFVSHDRYFIRRFATRVWMLEHGGITDFKGDYDRFLAARARADAPAQAPVQEKKVRPPRPGGTKELEKQTNAAERAVAKAETRMDELTQEIEEASTNFLKLQELYEQRETLEDEIYRLYAQWEALAEQLEAERA